MKCFNCGAELTDDSIFCSYCGVKIEEKTSDAIQHNSTIGTNITSPVSESISYGSSSEVHDSHLSQAETAHNSHIEKNSFGDKVKAKLHIFWKRLDLFCKTATVSIMIVAILLIVAICIENGLAIFLSVLQLTGLIMAVLMHKGIIKLAKKWIKYLVLVIAILFSILNIMSYSLGQKNIQDNTSPIYQPPISDSNNSSDTTVITTAAAPYGASDCIGKEYSIIMNDFNSAGFVSIKTEIIEDLKSSDTDKINTIESISVNGKTDFTQGQVFQKIDEVVIRYHAYEKCNAKISVTFIPNIIFNKYDVNLLVNGVKKGTLEHGVNQNFEFTIDPGEYTLSFESTEYSSVNGKISLIVDCDVEASYKIYCHSDEISIETLYVDKFIELAEDEVKLDVSASEYKYKNFEEVVTDLETLGFTNIKLNILYDIVWGWTEEGEVDSVSVNGNDNFKKGDVFKKDTPIVITYHMKEEDNPNKPTESETTIINDSQTSEPSKSSESTVDNLTIENCPELASMLSNKADIDDTYSSFATKYKGRIIEFDGRIDYCTKYENYNTRFDYLVSAGDYDPDHQIGPSFKFENVNYYDLNTDLDTVSVGLNVHIIAEVKSFDRNSGLFYLDPVSVTGR